MELDFRLVGPLRKEPCECSCCGNLHEREDREVFFESSITHNLGKMAREVGVYDLLWRPDEKGYSRAGQIADLLLIGAQRLNENKEKLKPLEPENGWGDWEELNHFVLMAASACLKYPEAEIQVSR